MKATGGPSWGLMVQSKSSCRYSSTCSASAQDRVSRGAHVVAHGEESSDREHRFEARVSLMYSMLEPSFPLVGSHQLSLVHNVSPHRLFQFVLGRLRGKV